MSTKHLIGKELRVLAGVSFVVLLTFGLSSCARPYHNDSPNNNGGHQVNNGGHSGNTANCDAGHNYPSGHQCNNGGSGNSH